MSTWATDTSSPGIDDEMMLISARPGRGPENRVRGVGKGIPHSRAWGRRRFLDVSGAAAMGVWVGSSASGRATPSVGCAAGTLSSRASSGLQLFLCGDVMTGRGIDQVLPRPSRPVIYESYVKSALGYVELAEEAHGPIRRPVGFDYIWGEALTEIEARSPDLRVVNLETSITTHDDAYPKGINYRMHPANVGCLVAAAVDCCVLANNHVMDWGVAGLLETLDTLDRADIATAGAGRDLAEADRPAMLDVEGKGRLLVFAFGHPSSGVPPDWAAGAEQPGVSVLPDLSRRSVRHAADLVHRWKRHDDRVVVSLHWGGNWGYDIPGSQQEFAHRLIDAGAADVVYGHSSHHPKGIEVHGGRPILYGCGDFINDYEGISGYEQYRSDLVMAYFVTLAPSSGRLARLEMTPFRTRRFRLERVARRDAEWIRAALDREGRRLGTRVELSNDGAMALAWT